MTAARRPKTVEPQRPSYVPEELDWNLVDWDKERFPDRPEIVLGAYRRGSTYGQRYGSRFQETFETLRRIAFSQGYGLVYFDEGTRSGTTLTGRQQLPNLLAFLQWSLIHGIISPDIKRLTRDDTMADGLEIAEVLQQRQGILVTAKPKRVWNLTDPEDYRDYRREVFEAGEDLLDIRDMFWGGMKDRVEQVLRNQWPPFFRGRVAFGYLQVVCYERRPGATDGPGHWGRANWTTDPEAGDRALSSRSHVARTWVKNPAWIEPLAIVREVLLTEPNAAEALRELRERGVASPWKSRPQVGQPEDTWLAEALYRILKQPIYGGRWQWIAQPGDSPLWKYHDPRTGIEVPELGFWTPAEHALFVRKFLDTYSPRRNTGVAHPFAGLARCTGCGAPLGAGGRASHVTGPLKGQLACPNRTRVEGRVWCPAPIFIAEDAVRRALEDALPLYLAELPKKRAVLEQELRQQQADPLGAQLAMIKKRQAAIQKMADDPDVVTDEIMAEMRALNVQRREVEAKRATQQTAIAAEEELRQIDEVLAIRPEQAYAELSVAARATFWRMLLACTDPNCGHGIEGFHVNAPYIDKIKPASGGSRPSPGVYRVRDVQQAVQQGNIHISLSYAFSRGGSAAAD